MLFNVLEWFIWSRWIHNAWIFIFLRSISCFPFYFWSDFFFPAGSVGSSQKTASVNEPDKIKTDKDVVFVAGATGRVGSRTVRLKPYSFPSEFSLLNLSNWFQSFKEVYLFYFFSLESSWSLVSKYVQACGVLREHKHSLK